MNIRAALNSVQLFLMLFSEAFSGFPAEHPVSWLNYSFYGASSRSPVKSLTVDRYFLAVLIHAFFFSFISTNSLKTSKSARISSFGGSCYFETKAINLFSASSSSSPSAINVIFSPGVTAMLINPIMLFAFTRFPSFSRNK